MTVQLMRASKIRTDTFDAPLESAFEQEILDRLDGRSWSCIETATGLFISLWDSFQHPGYYHYKIIRSRADSSEASRRPVLPGLLAMYLSTVIPAGARWRVTTDAPPDAAPAASPSQSVVYFIKAGPFVKIGKGTHSGDSRMSSLQTGCPFPMELLCHLPGGLKEEHALHRRFAAYHQRAEWFRYEGELAEFIHGEVMS